MSQLLDGSAALQLSSLSVVFPAFNEEKNIENAVRAALQSMKPWARSLEIVLVNDGSRDQTGSIADSLSRECPGVVAVHHPVNFGYGAALRSGFSRASGDYVFFTDSDLQFDLAEITRLLPHIAGNDIVTGYRAARADPWHRKLNALAWNILVRILFGIRVRDIDCAYKLFQKRVLDAMDLKANGAMINTEILALARLHGFSVHEVPVSHFPRSFGVPTGANLRVISRAFRELFRMYASLKGIRGALADSAQETAAAKAD